MNNMTQVVSFRTTEEMKRQLDLIKAIRWIEESEFIRKAVQEKLVRLQVDPAFKRAVEDHLEQERKLLLGDDGESDVRGAGAASPEPEGTDGGADSPLRWGKR